MVGYYCRILGVRGIVLGIVLLVATPSVGQSWTKNFSGRPLWMPSGWKSIEGDTLGINLSRNSAGKPVFTAPDILWGYNRDFNIVIRHDRGICFSDGCRSRYNDLSGGILYGLHHSRGFAIGVEGRVTFPGFNDVGLGLDLALPMRLQTNTGKVALFFTPEMYLGIAENDQYPSRLELPLSIAYRVNPDFEWHLDVAWDGVLSNYSETVRIPVGVGLRYAASRKLDVGTEFEFGNMFGRGATVNIRTLYLRLAYRWR